MAAGAPTPDAPDTAPQQDQFFIQLVCAVGGLILLFHPLPFIGNQAMLLVLQSSQFYLGWPRNYYYLPIIAGLLFLVTAALRNYRPGLSGVFAIQAVIATGAYAAMVSLRTVEPMVRSLGAMQSMVRPLLREFTPGLGSWILLLLSFVPLLAAGVLASRDSHRFEPLLATWLRSAATACVLMLVAVSFAAPDARIGSGLWRTLIFVASCSVFYAVPAFHPPSKRSFAIGAGIGYPLVMTPLALTLLGLSSWGPVRPEEARDIMILIAANVVLWLIAIAAAIGIRPKRPMAIFAGSAVSVGSAVLVLILLFSFH